MEDNTKGFNYINFFSNLGHISWKNQPKEWSNNQHVRERYD